MKELQILYAKNCEEVIVEIKKVLEETYGLKTDDSKIFEPLDEAYNSRRKQYNASILLRHLIQNKERDFALWVIDKDLYCENMNFIFGYASIGQGAVLSVYRLDSTELIQKEAIHEIGHVMGLSHCKNDCVMQFSNSLSEAKKKPSTLCERCRRLLEKQFC